MVEISHHLKIYRNEGERGGLLSFIVTDKKRLYLLKTVEVSRDSEEIKMRAALQPECMPTVSENFRIFFPR